jgi:hypothetical protein
MIGPGWLPGGGWARTFVMLRQYRWSVSGLAARGTTSLGGGSGGGIRRGGIGWGLGCIFTDIIARGATGTRRPSSGTL